MPVYRIPEDEVVFPHPDQSEPSGLLGVGGDLRPERLLLAYANGIFPWYSEGQPILWFSPDPRCVLEPSQLHIGRSLRKVLRKKAFTVTLDTAFGRVIDACKDTPRPGQEGTWITPDMREAYCRLHSLGYAHSVEVWSGDDLVGGLYGVALGRLFAGESMFSHASDASKTGLVWLVRQLQVWNFALVDAQVQTDTLTRMGAVELARADYIERIGDLVRADGRQGQWVFDSQFDPLSV
jgi:leucyl/phenylalanyl-tRNA--protein transferase